MVSNVPGPQQPVHLAGVKLDKMEFFLFSGIGIYFGIFSYNGMVSATVSLDQNVGVEPQLLVDFFPIAFETLYNEVCGVGVPKESPKDQPQSAASTASPVFSTGS